MGTAAGGNIIREVFTRLGVQTDPLALKRFEEAVSAAKEKMGQASSAAAGFSANIRGMGESAFGMAKEGASVQQIATAFEALGGTAEQLAQLREQTGGLVSDQALQRAMNLGKLFKLPAEEIPALMKIAQGASVALGTSVEKNLEDVFVAMARQSKLIADNLGTQMGSVEEINEEFAKRNKLNAKALTDEQKQLAFVQAFISKSEKQAKLADKAAENTFALLEAQVANVTDRVKLLLNKVLGGAILRLGAQYGPVMKRILDGFDKFWADGKNVEKAIRAIEVAVKMVAVGIAGFIGAKVFLGLANLVQWAISFARALTSAGQAAFSLNAKLLIIPAVLGGLVLLVEDIMVWLRGGDSLVGRFVKKFEDAPGPMGKIARFLRDAKPTIQAVFAATAKGFAVAVSFLRDQVWPIIKKIGQTAREWIGRAVEFMRAEGPGAVSAVVDAAIGLWGWIKKIAATAVDVALVVWDWLKAIGQVIADVAVAVWDALLVAYEAVVAVLADVWQALSPWVYTVIKLLEGIWNVVWAALQPIMEYLGVVLGAAWELLKSIGGFLYENIVPALKLVWEGVRVIWNVGLALVEWLGYAAALIATGFAWFTDKAAPYISGFFEGVVGPIGIIVGWIMEGAAFLIDVLTPAVRVLLGVFALIFQGIADGFKAAREGWDSFWGWIKGGIDTMATAFGAAFGALGSVVKGVFDTVRGYIQPVIDLIDATLGKAHQAAVMLGLADETEGLSVDSVNQALADAIAQQQQTKAAATAGNAQNIGQIQVNVTAASSDPAAIGAATKDGTQKALSDAGRDLAVGE